MKELSTRAGFGLGLGFLIKPMYTHIHTRMKSKLQGVVWVHSLNKKESALKK